jgi:hypothetical protein
MIAAASRPRFWRLRAGVRRLRAGVRRLRAGVRRLRAGVRRLAGLWLARLLGRVPAEDRADSRRPLGVPGLQAVR